MQPYDYTLKVTDPGLMARQGYALGVKERQEREILGQQKRKLEAARQRQQDLAKLAANPDAGAGDYSRMMAKYPEIAKELRSGFELMDDSKKEKTIAGLGQLLSVVSAGKMDIANEMIDDYIKTGNDEEAATGRGMKKILESSPQALKETLIMTLAANTGPDKFAETFNKIKSNRREDQQLEPGIAKTEAETEKLKAETEKLKQPEKNYHVLTDEEKQSIGLPIEMNLQMSPKGQITQIGSKGVNITNVMGGESGPKFGPLEKGTMLIKDENGNFRVKAVPGSLTEMNLNEIKQKAAKKQESTATSANIVINDINEMKRLIKGQSWDSPVTGLIGNLVEKYWLGSSRRMDVKQLSNGIKANIAIDKIQKMRSENKTGGAMGNVSDKDMQNLQSSLGSLELSQGEDQLLRNLDNVAKYYKVITDKLAAYPGAEENGFGSSLGLDEKGLSSWNEIKAAWEAKGRDPSTIKAQFIQEYIKKKARNK